MPLVPRQMHNTGFPIVSLSKVCRWLGDRAEALGINIFPGFDGKEILLADDGMTVTGVRTGDKGLDKDGKPKPNFEPGIDLLAKVTVLGEGARGSLMKSLAGKLPIRRNRLPEVFETGIKEVIQLPENHFFTDSPFNDIHTMGFPLGLDTPGGGFVYEMAGNRIALGFLLALGYDNPSLDLYDTFMRFKGHPMIQQIIQGGKVVEQGARSVSTGGWFSMPHLAVDGALFTGNGCRHAQHSGHQRHPPGHEVGHAGRRDHHGRPRGRRHRPTHPGRLQPANRIKLGRCGASGRPQLRPGPGQKRADQMDPPGRPVCLQGPRPDRSPSAVDDATTLNPMRTGCRYAPCRRAKRTGQPDDPAMVDKLTGVYLSGTLHREDQPSHILIHDQRVCVEKCYPVYGCPCTRFCPGDVYEMEPRKDGSGIKGIKLNFTNCLHCKTCDIKDPFHNVTWTCPEGGEGPNYKQA